MTSSKVRSSFYLFLVLLLVLVVSVLMSVHSGGVISSRGVIGEGFHRQRRSDKPTEKLPAGVYDGNVVSVNDASTIHLTVDQKYNIILDGLSTKPTFINYKGDDQMSTSVVTHTLPLKAWTITTTQGNSLIFKYVN